MCDILETDSCKVTMYLLEADIDKICFYLSIIASKDDEKNVLGLLGFMYN